MNRFFLLVVFLALCAFSTLADPNVQNPPKKSWISSLKDRLTGFMKPSTEKSKESLPASSETAPARETVVNLSEEETQVHITAAEQFIQANDIDKALNELYIVLQANPNHEYGCTLTGILLLSLKEFTGAEEFLYHAVKLSKWTNNNAIYHLSLLYSAQKDYDLAIRMLLKGVNVTNTLTAESAGPNRPPALEDAYLLTYGLAETYYTMQNYNLSAQYYYATAQQRPKDIDLWLKASTFYFPSTTTSSQNTDNTNMLPAWQKSYDYMERILLQSVQLNPNQPILLYHLGVVLHSTDRVAQATIMYEEALRLQNDYPEAIAALATAYHAQLRLSEALTYYNIAYTKNPQNLVLLCNFAQLLHALQKPQDRDLILQQAIQLDANHPEVVTTLQKLGLSVKVVN